jgi:predicted RecA/RadA family phage recombinase
MRNFVQDGKTVNVVATGAMVAGRCYIFPAGGTAGIFGVSPVDAAIGDTVALWTEGIFTFTKAAGQAWAALGAQIYWDPSANCATTVSTAPNFKIGVNTKTAVAGDANGEVRLSGSFSGS